MNNNNTAEETKLIKQVVASAHNGNTSIIETVDFIAGIKATLNYLKKIKWHEQKEADGVTE